MLTKTPPFTLLTDWNIMPAVIITVGIPASGKTTWAKEYVQQHANTVIVSRDDVREAQGFPYERWAEDRVTEIYRAQMAAYLSAGMDVICADTNIYTPFRKSLIDFAYDHGANITIKAFPIELDEAIRRDALRPAPVGEKTVKRFYDMWMSVDGINA